MKCIFEMTEDPKRVGQIIMEEMMRSRPRGEVVYTAYTKHKGMVQHSMLSAWELDFDAFDCGKAAIAKTILYAPFEKELLLTLTGNGKARLNGSDIKGVQEGDIQSIPLFLEQGENTLEIYARPTAKSFRISLIVSVPRYPFLWAGDYLYCVRPMMPIAERAGETGFAIYNEGKQLVFPNPIPKHEEVDFAKLGAEGEFVYAYAMAQGRCDIHANCPIKLWVDGNEIKEHSFQCETKAPVLLKLKRGESWNFTTNGNFSSPFAGQMRPWIWVGGFGEPGSSIHQVFAPETKIQFTAPMPDGRGNMVFWRFFEQDTYVRPILDTFFFGQWFYALMVGVHGLLKFSEKIGNDTGISYFLEYIKIMVEYYELMQYDAKQFENPTFLARSICLDNLDAIGTIGRNIADYYQMTGDVQAKVLLDVLLESMFKNVPRMADGTYYRTDTMWADDIYMSLPFLTSMAKITGDVKYWNEIDRQITGYKKRLWMAEKQLFSHIYFPTVGQANHVPWGRGNGWIFLTLSEVLEVYPKQREGRVTLETLFKDFAEGIAKNIDEDGRWHQVLTRKESYAETSCACMFITGMMRGVRNGWLHQRYGAIAEKAWQALLKNSVDEKGNVYGVCMGSGCQMEAEYYFDIPTVVGDDHGMGVILLAAAEMMI